MTKTKRRTNLASVIIYLFYFTVLFQAACTTRESIETEKQKSREDKISSLTSTNLEVADKATIEIFNSGKEMIRPLIENAENQSEFHGTKIFNPLSSQMQQKVTVGVASLYITEAIIRDNINFALNPLLLNMNKRQSDLSQNDPENVKIATRAYKDWLREYGGMDLKAIREAKLYPLANSRVYWYGTTEE